MPSTDHVCVASVSVSETESVPLTADVPATTAPLSRLPASVTEPAFASTSFVTTGTSFVPLIVTVTVCST